MTDGVTGRLLNGMSERMAQIEHRAPARFMRILLHYLAFHPDGAGDQGLQVGSKQPI